MGTGSRGAPAGAAPDPARSVARPRMMQAMRSLWLVALGGALGAVARAVLSTAIHVRWPSTLPWGTIVVNLVGCLVLGLLVGCP